MASFLNHYHKHYSSQTEGFTGKPTMEAGKANKYFRTLFFGNKSQ
jgi:hypothetical protein